EMMIGVPFEIDNRLQINMRVEPYDFLPLSQSIEGLYMPILWLNESALIDDESVETYKSDILAPQRLLYSFTYILMGLGGGMFLGAILALIRSKSNKTKIDEQFLEETVKRSGPDPDAHMYEQDM
ncbi:hypothetical protein, partial [Salmonella sp. s55044]|uniref:hypothetical protein n=1 Tax=Salmonella sp. s55044 TaxID=3159677 RepID=UPI00398134A4